MTVPEASTESAENTPSDPGAGGAATAGTGGGDGGATQSARHTEQPSFPGPKPRHRRLRSVAITVAFILGVAIASGALVMFALTRAMPSWWTTIDAGDKSLIAHGVNLENAVVNELSKPRESVTLRIADRDANIWLNTRLRPWLESQGDKTLRVPDQVRELCVDFRGGRLHVGARVEQNGASQVFAATLRPMFGKNGELWLIADNMSMGRLSLPASMVLGGETGEGQSRAAEKTREVSEEFSKLPQTRRVLAAFAGKNPIHSNPVIKLPDGRRFRITALTATGGKVSITLQPQTREQASRAGAPAEHLNRGRHDAFVEPPPVVDRQP